MIKQYRKKPVVISAIRFDYTTPCVDAIRSWLGEHAGQLIKSRTPSALAELEIKTLEDGETLKVTHIATEGDYIIQGVHGEFYACKPDIFHLTYESA